MGLHSGEKNNKGLTNKRQPYDLRLPECVGIFMHTQTVTQNNTRVYMSARKYTDTNRQTDKQTHCFHSVTELEKAVTSDGQSW